METKGAVSSNEHKSAINPFLFNIPSYFSFIRSSVNLISFSRFIGLIEFSNLHFIVLI